MMDNLDTLMVRPGVFIGDIKTDREGLHDAVTTLELEVADIKAQLAGEIPVDDTPEWRRKAQGALRAKIKALATVRALLGAMRRQRQAVAAATPAAPKPDRYRRAQVLLDTIRDEVGGEEFDRLKQIAKERRPDVFGEVAS